MSEPLRVLIIEDSEDDALLLVRELRRGGYDPIYARVETAEALIAALDKQTWDIIISDYSMPHLSGFASLALVKEKSFDLPFVIVSGTIGEDIAVACMKSGAHDYLMKSNLRRLVPAIERELREAEVRRDRKRYVTDLATLHSIGQSIISELELDKTVDLVLNAVRENLGFDRAFLFLIDSGQRLLKSVRSVGTTAEMASFFAQLQYSLEREDVGVVRAAVKNEPILIEDTQSPPIKTDMESIHKLQIKSYVAVPLKVRSKVIGVLAADRWRSQEKIAEKDKQLLLTFSDQAAIALENAKLYKEQAEKERLAQELMAARDIQMGLLPSSPPQIDGMDINGICLPAKEVGGDYFDYIWLDEEKKDTLFIPMADVSGKGMKAAMTVVMATGMLYSELGRGESMPNLLSRLNRLLYSKTNPETFIAFLLVEINIQSRKVTICNAGQPYPILKRHGKARSLETKNSLPLGISISTFYEEISFQLHEGDVLVFCTDGIREAMNKEEEIYDDERLERVISCSTVESTSELIDAILADVSAFVGTEGQQDDMTVVAVKVFDIL